MYNAMYFQEGSIVYYGNTIMLDNNLLIGWYPSCYLLKFATDNHVVLFTYKPINDWWPTLQLRQTK